MTQEQLYRCLRISIISLAVIPIYQLFFLANYGFRISERLVEETGYPFWTALINPPPIFAMLPWFSITVATVLALWAVSLIIRKSIGIMHLLVYQVLIVLLSIHLLREGMSTSYFVSIMLRKAEEQVSMERKTVLFEIKETPKQAFLEIVTTNAFLNADDKGLIRDNISSNVYTHCTFSKYQQGRRLMMEINQFYLKNETGADETGRILKGGSGDRQTFKYSKGKWETHGRTIYK